VIGRFKSVALHEPNKGLSNARNAALVKSAEMGASYFAFIDDDEIPDCNWIEGLYAGLQSGAAAAVGPVWPIFEAPPPKWAVHRAFYHKTLPIANGFVTDGYTANCLISVAAVNRLSLRFSSKFNEIGGEDTWFFKELLDGGGRIAWAESALVWDFIPSSRMEARWLMKRWYRTGYMEALLPKFDSSSISGRITNLARGFARLSGGTVLVLGAACMRPFSAPGTVLQHLFTVCRGAGLISSVFGRSYKEYASANYRG
jgi:succinoglycan biosynthesis protein ExoM